MSTTVKLEMGAGLGVMEISAETPEELITQMNSLMNIGTQPEKDVEEVILAKIVELVELVKPHETTASIEIINVLASAYQKICSVRN